MKQRQEELDLALPEAKRRRSPENSYAQVMTQIGNSPVPTTYPMASMPSPFLNFNDLFTQDVKKKLREEMTDLASFTMRRTSVSLVKTHNLELSAELDKHEKFEAFTSSRGNLKDCGSYIYVSLKVVIDGDSQLVARIRYPSIPLKPAELLELKQIPGVFAGSTSILDGLLHFSFNYAEAREVELYDDAKSLNDSSGLPISLLKLLANEDAFYERVGAKLQEITKTPLRPFNKSSGNKFSQSQESRQVSLETLRSYTLEDYCQTIRLSGHTSIYETTVTNLTNLNILPTTIGDIFTKLMSIYPKGSQKQKTLIMQICTQLLQAPFNVQVTTETVYPLWEITHFSKDKRGGKSIESHRQQLSPVNPAAYDQVLGLITNIVGHRVYSFHRQDMATFPRLTLCCENPHFTARAESPSVVSDSSEQSSGQRQVFSLRK